MDRRALPDRQAQAGLKARAGCQVASPAVEAAVVGQPEWREEADQGLASVATLVDPVALRVWLVAAAGRVGLKVKVRGWREWLGRDKAATKIRTVLKVRSTHS